MPHTLPTLYRTKWCNRCKTDKSVEDFAKNRTTKDGLQGYCCSCSSEIHKQQMHKNPKQRTAHRARENKRTADQRRKWRASHLRSKYGMSEEDYETLLANQDGVCAICKKDQKQRRLAVDHCHTTGVVRGLLCDACNHGIGKFKDNPDLLIAAANYLKEANE